MPGSRSSRRAELVAIDTETDSLDEMRAEIVGTQLQREARRGGLHPARATTTPTRPSSCRATRCSRSSSPGWRTARRRSWASTSSTTATCSPTTASRCRATRTTPCCRATCSKCTSRTASPAWRSGTWAARGIDYEDLCGKGAHQIPFSQVDDRQGRRVFVRGLRPDAGRAPRAVAAARGRREAALRLRAWRCASSEALYRIERNGVLIDAPTLAAQSQRTRQAHHGAGAGGLRARGPALQPRLAQADRRGVLHQARPAGRQEDAERRAEHRRRGAGEAGRGLSRCRPRSSSTAACPSSRAPTPTSCGLLANPRSGRVHTHYAQAVAVTGRLSSNDPNLQNIPIRTPEGRRVREAFVAPAGQRDRERRLLADRAAHHGPHQRRRVAAARLHRRHRRAPRDRRRGLRRRAWTRCRASSAAMRRSSTSA